MKKIITLINCWLISVSVHSQVTITKNDMVKVGNKVVLGTNIDSSYSPAINMSNQTWDFTALTSDEDEIWDVQKTEWNSYYPEFQNSNISLKNNDTYQFINIDDNALKACGTRIYNQLIDTFTTIKFNTPETIIQFPASLNGGFNTISNYTVIINYPVSFPYATPLGTIPVDVDKIKISAKRIRNSLNDASGTLKTPLGNYSALRIKDVLIETDSIYANVISPFTLGYIALPNNAFPGISNPIIDTTTSYNWWTNNLGYSLLSFNYDNNKSRNVKWLKEIPVLSNLNDNIKSVCSIFPNPSAGKLFIDNKNMNVKSIEIYDYSGKLLRNVIINNVFAELDISEIEPGLYFCHLIDEGNKSIKKEKFVIIK
jgi:hypothetical protein